MYKKTEGFNQCGFKNDTLCECLDAGLDFLQVAQVGVVVVVEVGPEVGRLLVAPGLAPVELSPLPLQEHLVPDALVHERLQMVVELLLGTRATFRTPTPDEMMSFLVARVAQF